MERKGEEQWFRRWTPEVQRLVEPYQAIATYIRLRPIEIQEGVQYVLCTRILNDARRHNPEAWAEGAAVLRSEHSLARALRRLFGSETPSSVAAMALGAVFQESDEHDEGEDVAIGRVLRERETEREKLGLPSYVWVVRIVGEAKMAVAVESRDKLRDRTVGLIRVVDAR